MKPNQPIIRTRVIDGRRSETDRYADGDAIDIGGEYQERSAPAEPAKPVGRNDWNRRLTARSRRIVRGIKTLGEISGGQA